jgi:hypothetical protein
MRSELSKRMIPPQIERECKICGSVFLPKIYRQKYCCYRCGVKAEIKKRCKKPKFKNCQLCGKQFEPYNSLDKYCSSECRIGNLKAKRSYNYTPEKCAKILGDKNPAYRNGMYVRSAKRQYKGNSKFIKTSREMKSAMKEHYGYLFCEHCNTSTSPRWETHHIIYRSEKPRHPNLHDKDNLIIVCIMCHNDFHKHKGMRDNLVKSRGLDKIFGVDVLDKSEAKENGFSESRII